ncbi:MAG: response regulator [Desulfobacterales bacterium]|nr:response regulator [Desulfobacterales bacterium]
MNPKKPLILIVDDNLKNLQFLGALLKKNGYEVGIAEDGFKAIAFLEDTKPDLILLDIMMPGMDGYEVCQKIKQDPFTMSIPVIFLTAKSENDDLIKAFESGCVDYIKKPFNSLELLARVKTHVEITLLRELIPICSHCKNIRDDKGVWEQMETYFAKNTHLKFSHGLCPSCCDSLYGKEDWYQKRKKKK